VEPLSHALGKIGVETFSWINEHPQLNHRSF
jgi:hypothetical protein